MGMLNIRLTGLFAIGIQGRVPFGVFENDLQCTHTVA